MVTIMLVFIVGLLLLAVTPWIGYLNHNKLNRTDLIAGDEGED
jgi:hypothetical protein